MNRVRIYYIVLAAALLTACSWVVRDDGRPHYRGYVDEPPDARQP
jgi:hypothetical protein